MARGRRRRPRRSSATGRAPGGEVLELHIDGIGARGDGLARDGAGRLFYVPYTAPGDHVRISVGAPRGDGHVARLDEVLTAGPRRPPACRHFSHCGGCATQHLDETAEADWKRELVRQALARRGLDVAVAEPLRVSHASRRRVAFTAFRSRDGLAFGYNAADSNRIVDIQDCPLLLPALAAMIAPLRQLAEGLVENGERSRFHATLLAEDRGAPALDLVIGGRRPPTLDARQALAAFAERHDVARISWQEDGQEPEPVAARRPVMIRFGGVDVALPPATFLQPCAEGEAAIVSRVIAGLDGTNRVADLYAGLGTISLPLLTEAGRRVRAVDGDGAAMAALATAAGRASLGGRLSSEARDLALRPLTSIELADIDGVVFDPPRAGARAQAETLAETPDLHRVVAVSCNPATFARDARILVDGGFNLVRVEPIDQFRHAAHIELVAAFERR